MKLKFFIFFTTFLLQTIAQEKEYNSAIVKINRYVEGSLITPYSDIEEVPLVIFIMDSGAINRDGNDRMSKNDSFKELSYELAKRGVASFRFDKRLFKIEKLGIREHEITLNHFITDVNSIVEYFKKSGNYTNLILAGHGQGSLIGMIAAKNNVDRFISIAGSAQSMDQVIIEQLMKEAPELGKNASVAFAELKEKGRTTNYNPALESIFGYKLQSFMRSWIKFVPSEEIKNLEIPILIIHGDKDIQVDPTEAERLKESVPTADYVIIKNMNHILKEIKGNRLENYKSYNEGWRKIMPEFIDAIVNFANK